MINLEYISMRPDKDEWISSYKPENEAREIGDGFDVIKGKQIP